MSSELFAGIFAVAVTALFFLHEYFPVLRRERPRRRLLEQLARSRGVSVQRVRDKFRPHLLELAMGDCTINVTFEYATNGRSPLWTNDFVVEARALRFVPGFEADFTRQYATQPDLDVRFMTPDPKFHPELHAQAVAVWSPRARLLATSLDRSPARLRSEGGALTLTFYRLRDPDLAETAIQLVAELAGAEVVEPPPTARVVDA